MGGRSERKKELIRDYKEQKHPGGVYKITNIINGRYILKGDANIQGCKNRFEFCKRTGSCVHMKLQQDWKKYGAEAFTFEVLEEIQMKETQTPKEFAEDIKFLEEIWSGKYDSEKAY